MLTNVLNISSNITRTCKFHPNEISAKTHRNLCDRPRISTKIYWFVFHDDFLHAFMKHPHIDSSLYIVGTPLKISYYKVIKHDSICSFSSVYHSQRRSNSPGKYTACAPPFQLVPLLQGKYVERTSRPCIPFLRVLFKVDT